MKKTKSSQASEAVCIIYPMSVTLVSLEKGIHFLSALFGPYSLTVRKELRATSVMSSCFIIELIISALLQGMEA